MIAKLPHDEITVYAGEVHIHLYPKIGQNWIVRSNKKEVPHQPFRN